MSSRNLWATFSNNLLASCTSSIWIQAVAFLETSYYEIRPKPYKPYKGLANFSDAIQ